MKFKDLYDKGLDRKVNPAVSASDLTDETVLTEIVEYVFTEEIIINLYNILTNIKVNQGSHIGIWIIGLLIMWHDTYERLQAYQKEKTSYLLDAQDKRV